MAASDAHQDGAHSPDIIDLGVNLPLYAIDPDLTGALRELANRDDLGALLSYQPLAGHERYRRAGADWMARHGLDIAPAQVVVTGGAQHAITVALGANCRPGDRVLGEALTYPGLEPAASLLGLEVVPVAMDAGGLDPVALDRAASVTGARVLYCMPTLHNPTTITMSAERRAAIAEVVRKRDLLVIEDDAHGQLEPAAPPPLATQLGDRTLYITSTSKVLAGGLRVAFVAAPTAMVERLTRTVGASLWALPALGVELVAMWIADGTADKVLRRKQNEARERQEMARQYLPAGSYRDSEHSYYVWLELPDPWRAGQFARQARELGVVVAPASAFTIGNTEPPAAVRLSLSSPLNRDHLRRGLETLAGLLERGPAPAVAIV